MNYSLLVNSLMYPLINAMNKLKIQFVHGQYFYGCSACVLLLLLLLLKIITTILPFNIILYLYHSQHRLLCNACWRGDLLKAQQLVKEGAQVNWHDPDGVSSICLSSPLSMKKVKC